MKRGCSHYHCPVMGNPTRGKTSAQEKKQNDKGKTRPTKRHFIKSDTKDEMQGIPATPS